jgi:hypothetical protein
LRRMVFQVRRIVAPRWPFNGPLCRGYERRQLAATAILAPVFDVEIWGTVASWVGVSTTGGAAVAAAWYYVNDKRLEAIAQARQVRVLIDSQPQSLKATVFNYSEHPIYDVAAETHPMTLTETLVHRKTAVQDPSGKAARLKAQHLAQLRTMFAQSGAPGRAVLKENYSALMPAMSADILYGKPQSPAARYSVVFRDHMSRPWRLEYWTDGGEPHTRLTHTRGRRAASYARELARHPLRNRVFIRRWADIWWWEKRNRAAGEAATDSGADDTPAEPEQGQAAS